MDDTPRDARLRSLCRMLAHARGEAGDLDLDELIPRLEQALEVALATLPRDTAPTTAFSDETRLGHAALKTPARRLQ